MMYVPGTRFLPLVSLVLEVTHCLQLPGVFFASREGCPGSWEAVLGGRTPNSFRCICSASFCQEPFDLRIRRQLSGKGEKETGTGA